MKKILFIAQDGIGGAERVMVTLAKLLSTQNFKISFLLVSRPNSNSTSLAELLNNSFAYTKTVWNSQFGLIKSFIKSIKEEKPDLVFSSAMHFNQRLCLISPLFPRTKFIVRNDNYLYTLPKFKRAALKWTYRLADSIIGQTDEMGKELKELGLSPDRIHVVRNPIDRNMIEEKLKEPSPFDSSISHPIFVGIGRFSHQKGFDILVDAFAEVIKTYPSAQLFLLGNTQYGNGEVYEKIQTLIHSNNLESNIHMPGHILNPFIYLKHADVFVLSSRWEGLPNVLLEAEYVGVPSAATTCIPVISRMVKEGETGYLSNSEDSHSLAKAMICASKLPHFKYNDEDSNDKNWIATFTSLTTQQ